MIFFNFSGASLGLPWGLLVASWGLSGASCGLLGPSGGLPGASLGPPWGLLKLPGASLGLPDFQNCSKTTQKNAKNKKDFGTKTTNSSGRLDQRT